MGGLVLAEGGIMDLWEAVRVRRFSGRHARWERVAELKPQDREEKHGLN